MYVKQFNLLKK